MTYNLSPRLFVENGPTVLNQTALRHREMLRILLPATSPSAVTPTQHASPEQRAETTSPGRPARSDRIDVTNLLRDGSPASIEPPANHDAPLCGAVRFAL